MLSPTLHTEADICAANINTAIDHIFGQLTLLANDVISIWKSAAASGKKPTSKDLSVLKPKIAEQFNAQESCVCGAGVVLEPGTLEDKGMYLEWGCTGHTGKIVPMALNFNHRSERFYNYQNMPWFSRPKSSAENVAIGPYIDLYGTDMYIMTFSHPIHVDGRFIGIAGADIAFHLFEKILLTNLVKMGNEALIVSEEGRVIMANTANWTIGDMANHLITHHSAESQVIELGANTTNWSLIQCADKRKFRQVAA